MKGETTTMSVRETFEEELKQLQQKLVDLANFAYDALGQSIKALENHDVDHALRIMDGDSRADLMYEELNDFATLLIAKQQPVAVDLRRILIAIRISTDVERIADFAVNIAKSTIRIGQESHLETITKLKKMYEISGEMFRDALKAFNEEDLSLAKKVADMDDQVDALYGETIAELFEMNKEHPENLPQVMQMLFICRYLERTADHITNISEYIFYLVKGRHYDLNQ
ncbi:phosphate transport system protein [Bacillus benzoevorans]|uniref:Phosphate-specific transport system accessory protein PhoU n=2 Tax=Bacillus benzoevorans TaxID=1456 RepID=A0A7X0LVU3_9BACI|nr:phosphate transport system protein [Bacillus benzoevorans]